MMRQHLFFISDAMPVSEVSKVISPMRSNQMQSESSSVIASFRSLVPTPLDCHHDLIQQKWTCTAPKEGQGAFESCRDLGCARNLSNVSTWPGRSKEGDASTVEAGL